MQYAVINVSDQRRRSYCHQFQAQRWNVVEQSLARAEGAGGDVGAKLVDASGCEVLIDYRCAPGDRDVAAPAQASVRAASMPSAINVNVVPPSIVSGSRA